MSETSARQGLPGAARRTALVGGIVLALSLAGRADAQVRRLDPPKAMPAFRLQDLDGRTHRLEDYRGRVLVLSLWASWCMPCRFEMPAFQKARSEVARTHPDAVLMTVNIAEDAARAREWLERERLDVPVLLAGQEFVDEVDVISIPTILVIDAAGRIVVMHEGWANGTDLTAELTSEISGLAGSAPKPAPPRRKKT